MARKLSRALDPMMMKMKTRLQSILTKLFMM